MDQIDPVERAILRIGAYELIQRPDMPFKVILNEAINLAKCFGADGSHKYVNGILDKLAQQKRQIEVKIKTAIKTDSHKGDTGTH